MCRLKRVSCSGLATSPRPPAMNPPCAYCPGKGAATRTPARASSVSGARVMAGRGQRGKAPADGWHAVASLDTAQAGGSCAGPKVRYDVSRRGSGESGERQRQRLISRGGRGGRGGTAEQRERSTICDREIGAPEL